MIPRRTLKRAAQAGERALRAAIWDCRLNRQASNDLRLAANMLQQCPDLLHHLPVVLALLSGKQLQATERRAIIKLRHSLSLASERGKHEPARAKDQIDRS